MVGIKDIWNKVKKGVKAGMLAIQDKDVDNNQIVEMIREFKSSDRRKWMIVGERYYDVENDIKERKLTKIVDDKVIEEIYKANNKLAHSKYKNMVDEKVNYLLAKPYTITCENKVYADKIREILDKHFQYQLTGLGYEASNKGIGWLYAYIDSNQKFRTMVIPSEQCIPVWRDNSHEELDAMIRVYYTTLWIGSKKKEIENVEVWTPEGVTYYVINNNTLILDVDRSNDNNGPIAHYKVQSADSTEWRSWGRVPFIPFKNNRKERPDIKYIKSLLDAYDLSRSEAANYVEEVKNLIYVLKGYGGEDIGEFMDKLNRYRAIPIDDPSDGGVDTLTPTMDITALREHYEQLKRDLIEDGQSINKDLDKFGSSPSGIALKFMYAPLDLKCNALETEFIIGVENILYFIDIFLKEKGLGDYFNTEVDVIFNRNLAMNETEIIENCKNSKGIISDETIIGNHPWTNDIEKEKENIKKEEEEKLPNWDRVPITEGGNNE